MVGHGWWREEIGNDPSLSQRGRCAQTNGDFWNGSPQTVGGNLYVVEPWRWSRVD
jgi:hypothetical protein